MSTGTAQLLFGATHRTHGGLIPFLSLWLWEGGAARWRVASPETGALSWRARSDDRLLSDALVLLVALTTTPRDPVPVALDDLAGDVDWRSGDVDLTTWRHYDAARLDQLVAETEPAGKLVLSVLHGSRLDGSAQLDRLRELDWDVDLLTASHTRRRADRDLHQAPPPRLPQPRRRAGAGAPEVAG